jgi:DNA N-6-adenine-methyltransferase (Dam)
MTDQPLELTLDDARNLYEQFAGQDGDEAVRVMAQIALWAKRQQVEGGRLRLFALRQLGRFLIRNGRPRGRPAKTSTADVFPTLVCLGITDRHISADAKSVARISKADFDAYLAQEDEPTLKGLLRFAEHTRIGQPYPKMGLGAFARANMQKGRSFLDPDDETSTTEWYTPPEIFSAMETDFDLDVCSPGAEIVPWIPAKRHLTKRDNGLVVDWHGFVWMNAPYGIRNGIAEWIEKFIEHGNGVAIAPDFTSTEWWHTLTERAAGQSQKPRNPGLRDALAAVADNGIGKLNKQAVANWIARQKNKIIDGYKVIEAGKLNGYPRWRVIAPDKPTSKQGDNLSWIDRLLFE